MPLARSAKGCALYLSATASPLITNESGKVVNVPLRFYVRGWAANNVRGGKGVVVMRNDCDVSKNEIVKRFGRALQVSVGYGWQKFDWDECEARNGRDVLSDTFWRSLRDELKGKCDGVTKSTGIVVNLKRLRAGHGRILWLDIFERIKKSDVLVFDVAAAPDAKTPLKNACDIKDVVTGLNANVLVEIGVALGLGKRVLLLCPEHLLKTIPSDIKGFLWTTYFGKIKDGKFERKFSDEYGFQGGFMGMLKDVVRETLEGKN